MSARDDGFARLDEANILARIRSGDASAYRDLYETVFPVLLRFAFSIARSREIAEDAVQATLVDVWINRTRWNPARPLRAYFYRAVRNRLIDASRHADVVRRAETMAAGEESFGMATPPPPADRAVESLDLVDAVAEAIRHLPERQRTAAILRWYEGMTTEEAAAVMGVARQVVEKLLGKATAKLRIALREARD